MWHITNAQWTMNELHLKKIMENSESSLSTVRNSLVIQRCLRKAWLTALERPLLGQRDLWSQGDQPQWRPGPGETTLTLHQSVCPALGMLSPPRLNPCILLFSGSGATTVCPSFCLAQLWPLWTFCKQGVRVSTHCYTLQPRLRSRPMFWQEDSGLGTH